MKKLLIIFAKAPEPGQVKTRLTPFLSPETAARLQQAFLLDILKMTRNVASTRLIACAPDTSHSFFQRCKKEEAIRLMPQKGKDLGERMKQAFQWAFCEGFEKVVIIGCDSPTLCASHIEDAFERLVSHSAVIGPSLDGGYYLIGAKMLLPQLFTQMNWGTETVLSETLKRLNTAKQPYHLLPFWYDIDLPADLIFLKQHLQYQKMKGKIRLTETTQIIDDLNIPF